MKKAWQKPMLEVLDIKMTMWNLKGEHPDGSWIDHVENIIDGTMNSMS